MEEVSILKDAKVYYFSDFLNKEDADGYFHNFNHLDWSLRNYNNHKLKRETSVYADTNLTEKGPSIWGEDAMVNVWTEELRKLKKRVESKVSDTYNICLGNRYMGGNQFIAFHSDNEEYGTTKSIASVSLGTPRSFSFYSKTTDERVTLMLEHGSLLLMGENTQERYVHGMKKESVDKNNTYSGVRINLTFRKFIYKPSPSVFV